MHTLVSYNHLHTDVRAAETPGSSEQMASFTTLILISVNKKRSKINRTHFWNQRERTLGLNSS